MPTPRNEFKPRSRAHRGTVGARVPVIELPASGCSLPAPDLPHGREWTAAEQARWVELWGSPQATQWDESARGTVAVLVVYESALFSGSAAAWQAQEARYAADSLGLTPKSLASLGWRVVEGQ